MRKADLTVKEVDRPSTGRCASGHFVPPPSDPLGLHPRSEGAKPEAIRFYKVIGHGQNDVYCEPCLILANHMAKVKKEMACG